MPGSPYLEMVRTSMDTEVEVDPINTKTKSDGYQKLSKFLDITQNIYL